MFRFSGVRLSALNCDSIGADEDLSAMPIELPTIEQQTRVGDKQGLVPPRVGVPPVPRALTRVQRLGIWAEARALFIVAVSAVVILSLAGIPNHFSQDGWLALIAGRDIAAHGIPQHDFFTHMAYGVRWIDQQWLAQLLMYEIERVGGLQLLTVTYVLVTGAAFAGAVAAARRLGGEDLHVLALLPAGAFFYLATAVSIRTQGFAYPLFVATLWLLASEVRGSVQRLRVYWVFPLLVLWANLHGSVTMGVGLAVLYGLTRLLAGIRSDGVKGLTDKRAWAFIVISPLTLLATPYGTAIIHYYKVTLLNSDFGRLVSEWKPVTSIPVLAVPLFVLIAATLYTVVRGFLRARARGQAARTPLFDAITLMALAIGAITAVRNITWFGLAVMILMPAALTQLKLGAPAPLRRARINRIFAIVMAAIAAVASIVVLARPDSWFTSTYPSNAVPTLKHLVANDPQVKIFADVRYADWLIWEDPQLFSGRIAYDTSLELLTRTQLDAIADPAAGRAHRPGVLAPYGIWVLYPGNKTNNRVVLREPGVKVIARNRKVVIATHPVTGAGREVRS
jgi:hypothetical protein